MTGLGSITISLGKLAVPSKNAQVKTIDNANAVVDVQGDTPGTIEDVKAVLYGNVVELEVA